MPAAGKADLEATIARARAVLEHAPAGLFCDIDGTLSPIAPRAELATISDEIRRALSLLSARLSVVAAVTGRSVDDAWQLVRVPELTYVGNHGAERLEHGEARLDTAAAAYSGHLRTILEAARAALADPTLEFEHKVATAAIHYRLSPDPQLARQTILNALSALPELGDVVVTDGRRVVNLLVPDAPNKGSAVYELAVEHQLKGVVYLGDDTTDIDAFRGLARLKSEQGCETLAVAVLSPEAPNNLASQADATVEGVDQVQQLLALLATQSH